MVISLVCGELTLRSETLLEAMLNEAKIGIIVEIRKRYTIKYHQDK